MSTFAGCVYNDHAWTIACQYEPSLGCNGGYSWYSTQEDCNSDINKIHRTCCKKSASCTECTPGAAPSCPTGTVGGSSGSTDEHSKTSTCCTNPSGCTETQNCNSRQCYCAICTPPTCESVSLSSTPLGYGSTTTEACCLNGVQTTPNREEKCDQTCNTCYCDKCVLNACPAPLSNTATTPPTEDNLILPDFRTCTNDCDRTRTGDCYEPFSPQPTEELEILAVKNAYDFISYNHTGIPGTTAGDLNDPANMIATYTDVNGASDIEALAVWFRPAWLTGEIATPVWTSTTASPQSSSTNSWGFMMHKEYGEWVPYVPSWEVSPQVWVKATFTEPLPGQIRFRIAGPTGAGMVLVTITAPISSAGNTVTMPFRLKFAGMTETVSEINYRIFLMGLDKFSYTPYNNYLPDISMDGYWERNQLRYKTTVIPTQTYARDWYDTLKRWVIDKEGPTIQFTGNTPSASGNTILVSWSASDTKNLYSIVGNIYSTAVAEAREISFPLSTGGVTFNTPFTPGEEDAENTGKLQGDWAFKVNANMDVSSHTGSVSIDVGGNRTGSLIFYLTVFDDAGNMATTSQAYDLNDWFVTDGGLAYSEGGTTFQTRTFDLVTTPPGIWSDILPPFTITGESLKYNYADYSSEMWAEKTTIGAPTALEKYIPNQEPKSYNIRRFKGHGLVSYYNTLLQAYEKNKGGIPKLKEQPSFTDNHILNSSLVNTGYCGNINNFYYCGLKFEKNLTVNDNSNLFRCTTRAVIFVGGDLTIVPPILNTNSATYTAHASNLLGCIFVVKGDVIIKEGKDESSSSSLDSGYLRYDRVNAYILADGDITMTEENKTATRIRDGLYINGGIQSLGAQGIVIERYLRLLDRFTFPILAIDGHPKYGVLGGVFFGNDFMMQKTEVGLKPY